MLLNKLTASLKTFFFFSEGLGVESIKIIVTLEFNLIPHGRAASIAKKRKKKNFYSFCKMNAASCTPKVLAYVMVFFFHFESLKPHSVLGCWFILALYTVKLFTISFLNNLSWVFCFFSFWASTKCLCRTVHNDCKTFTRAVVHYKLVTGIYVC